MTPADAKKLLARIIKANERVNAAAQDVVTFSRGLVTTLRDHAAMASADELARLIHVVDSEAAEAIEIFKQDPEGVFDLIMNAERGEKP